MNFRNQDFQEVMLERDGKVLLRFAIANGFRNIQNFVQKLKRGKCIYDYVEVMACPSGKQILLFEFYSYFSYINNTWDNVSTSNVHNVIR